MRVSSVALLFVATMSGLASQPPSPQPGRPDGIANPTSQTQQRSGNSQGPPGGTSSIANPATTSNASDQRPTITTPDKQQPQEQPVSVRSLPPIDVPRDWVDYSQIGLTLVVLLLAIWQIILLKDTVAATKIAAAAAKISADVARDAVYVADSAAIHFQQLKWETPAYHVAISWRNVGKTRAYRVEIDLELAVAGKSLPRPIHNDLTVMTPNQTHTIHQIPVERAVYTGEAPLQLSGSIRYHDIFRRQHTLSVDGVWVRHSEEFDWVRYETTMVEPD